MKLDITKLELADVLVALVNGGSTATITVHGRMPTLTHRLARELIEEAKATGSLYFDSVMGRTLNINFDDRTDDQRRIAAENWCCHHTQHRWFRRVLTERGIAQFHFDDQNEATMFWLAN